MSEDVVGRLNEALAGQYRVERELGEGGMATVYLAHDERHDRPVAVKVLRPELTAIIGAERFLAEIRTTANLRHPHILPLFDSGEAAGFLYYVMPYEVDTLRERLTREHQLPVEEAVRIAIEVAEALDYAHRHGVIHRDVKPGNILLEEDRPQIADFGIALAVTQTEGARRLTETGLSLGSPHYMSPEQASGDGTVDGRSDVFALGCVLYEMLAGRPPFAGRTAQAVLAKILTTDPEPVTRTRRTVPVHVEAALTKALERLPADRFGSAQDFADALADPSFRHAPVRELDAEAAVRAPAVPAVASPDGGVRGPALRPWLVAAVGAVGLVSAFLLGRGLPWGEEPGSVLRLTLDLGDLDIGSNNDVLIAPDGSTFAMAATPPGGTRALYVRRAGEVAWRALPGTEGASAPAYSPGGLWLVFHQPDADAILKVEVDGGLPVTLVTDAQSVRALSWGDDASIIFSGPDGLFRIPESGGTPDPLYQSTEVLFSARLLPGGSGIIASDTRRRVRLFELATDSLRTLVDEGVDPTYLDTGHILYGHPAGGLYVVPFDLDRLQVSGPPTPVLDGVSAGFFAPYSVSRTGSLVYASGGPSGFQLPGDQRIRVVGADGTGDLLPVAPSRITSARFSPDGGKIAFSSMGLDASTTHVYTYDLELGGPTQLTFEGLTNRSPVWSPEGTRIAFVSSRETNTAERSIYVRALDQRQPRAAVLSREAMLTLSDWGPGDLLVFTEGLGSAADIWTVPARGDAEPRPYLSTERGEAGLTLAPNGRWGAYTSAETETTEVYVRRFPEAVSQGRISVGGGTHPRWARAGDAVYYLKAGGPGADTIFAAQVQLEPTFVRRSREVAYVGEVVDFDVHPDGERLLIVEPVTAQAGGPDAARVYVVTNWFEELRARLGAE